MNSFPFNATAVELHEYSLLSEQILRGRGNFEFGVGFGERAPDGSPRQAFFNDAPWIDPPPGSRRVQWQDETILPAFLAPPNTVFSYRVPTGFSLVMIEFFCNDIQPMSTFVDGSGTIVWRLEINRRPVDGMGRLILQQGTAANPREFRKLGVEAFSGELVEVVVFDPLGTGPTGDRIAAGFGGFLYPSQGR